MDAFQIDQINGPPPPQNALIVEAQANFALNLVREVSKGGRSFIVSPFSVAIALSMVYAGAREKTGKEIGKLLANGAPDSEVHKYFGDLLEAIKNGGRNDYILDVANKMYMREGFKVMDAFKEQIEQYYGGQFEEADFSDSAGTAKKINQFVEEATHQKIRGPLVLVNAVYFKGNWAERFNAKYTKKKTFFVDQQNSKELEMMHKTADFIYFEDGQLQLLGMPYKGGEVFMFVLLPKDRFGLAKLLANLDGKRLLKLTKKRFKMKVQVVLPKFKLESTLQLEKSLANMGMPTAFSDSATFDGIAGGDSLKISDVMQKAFIEINEQGTEATAATGIRLVNEEGTVAAAVTIIGPVLCSACSELAPPKFVANRPFAAFLVNYGQIVLFSYCRRRQKKKKRDKASKKGRLLTDE
ncbi:hypothetical protein niasHT_033707 [Heterodera trifolii]|uniref:Serpin domain-containing protein n=1 Tax=Heterodera trifolii TaxID=157864 RepID=A0ABD2I7P2_9BILA